MAVAAIGRSKRRGWWALAAAGIWALPALAAPTPAATETKPPPAAIADLFGNYLAGRHAERLRDYPAAASWFDKAITADPDSPELISRTFLMAVGAGNFDRARPLADQELKIDSTDALARLVLRRRPDQGGRRRRRAEERDVAAAGRGASVYRAAGAGLDAGHASISACTGALPSARLILVKSTSKIKSVHNTHQQNKPIKL